MNALLSIDIGGTKTRVIIYSKAFKILKEQTFVTQDYLKKGGEEDLYTLFEHTLKCVEQKSFLKVGISINCAIKENSIIYSSLLDNKKPIDLKNLVGQYFSFKSFQSDNDVHCMAKAELKRGIGKDHTSFLFVNLGTGIRFVNVDNGIILRGFKNMAGEISSLPVWIGAMKKYVIADEVMAGKGIVNISRTLFNKSRSAEEIFSENDKEVIEIYTQDLARFLFEASLFYNPQVIIFAGSFIKSERKWLPQLQKYYFSQKPTFLLSQKLLVSKVEYPASIGAVI